MSIYKVLSLDIPVLAYSVLHQPRKTVTTKEYAKSLLGLRTELMEESQKIQTAWQNYLSDMTAKTVQTTRGNLSQFLSTPLQSDTGEIQHIISDQIGQTGEQLLPKMPYGLVEGYDGRMLIDAQQSEIPKARTHGARTFLQQEGFKIGRNSVTVFESLYFLHGSFNLDIFEHLVHSCNGLFDSSHGTKSNRPAFAVCSLYNLLFLDGNFERNTDRFELQLRFAKGKESNDLFHNELNESLKTFRLEVHDLNVSIWQKKLGLGTGEEYILRIKTKDRSTLRAVIPIIQKFSKEKNIMANAFEGGIWLAKEII